MPVKLYSGTFIGIDSQLVEVEIDLGRGIPSFHMVGLPDTAVRESEKRVRSAIINSGFDYPRTKVIINLAPGDIKKSGAGFDLAIALGIIAAQRNSHKLKLQDYLVAGELSLSGKLRKTKGILSLAFFVRERGLKGLIIPQANKEEAALVSNINIYPVQTLKEAVRCLYQKNRFFIQKSNNNNISMNKPHFYKIDMKDVKGQEEAKRALEIAAAGNHNLLISGPPGSGKSMLARRISTIIPPPSKKEAYEITKIYSILGLLQDKQGLINKRPFRAPHHTITKAGLIGGGRIPEPGEITLAHRGILFLDEFSEFNKNVLDVLRQPLEEGQISLVRSGYHKLTFPCEFLLIAAQNPCKCGFFGSDDNCSCSYVELKRHHNKLSGPLLDRIDMQLEIPALKPEQIVNNTGENESSSTIRKRVISARIIQRNRYINENYNCNSKLKGSKLKKYCAVEDKSKIFLLKAIKKLSLSARAYDIILRLARTIADLDQSKNIQLKHLSEAIQYRSLDRIKY